MKIGRKGLFHAYRRTSSTDISGHSEQILHRDHLHLLVTRNLGQGLQINFTVSRNDADQISGPVAVKHQSLEYTGDILAKTISDMLSGKVILDWTSLN